MFVRLLILGRLWARKSDTYMNYCQCGCKTKVKKSWATGHHRRGQCFTLSDEAKKKISLAMLGAKNPRFGKPGTCIGRKQTPEQRLKIKEARARQIITAETRRKQSLSMKKLYAEGTRKGEDSIFYIDGRHKGLTPIKKSLDYKLWREAVFTRDKFTCQDCKIQGGELQAHHIKPQSIFPELRFAIDNGLTLCRSCHTKTDTWGLRNAAVKESLMARTQS